MFAWLVMMDVNSVNLVFQQFIKNAPSHHTLQS